SGWSQGPAGAPPSKPRDFSAAQEHGSWSCTWRLHERTHLVERDGGRRVGARPRQGLERVAIGDLEAQLQAAVVGRQRLLQRTLEARAPARRAQAGEALP